MRALLVIMVGVLSGAVGAFSLHHSKTPDARNPPASRDAAPAPILPPGWDLAYLPGAAATGTAADPKKPGLAREAERRALYQRELENQKQLLQSHDREPIDAAWAGAAEAEVRSSLDDAAAEPGFAVSRVECRAKTCVAEVSFPSPAEALGQRHELAQIAPPSCHGIAAVLNPPAADGPYSTQVVYFCR